MTTCFVPSTIRSSFSRISARALCVADDRRHGEAARDDRRVRRDAAEVGDEAGEAVRLELDHVGRREIVRDQDRVLLGAGRREPRPACRAAASARARPPARRRPCARAGRRPRSSSNCSTSTFICCRQRPLGVAVLLGDDAASASPTASDRRGSSQCTSRKAPNSAGASPAVIAPCKPSSSRAPREIACVEARDLAGDAARRNRVVRDFERRVRDELRPPDGDPAGDAETVEGEARRGTGVRSAWRSLGR